MRVALFVLMLSGCALSPDERETASLRPAALVDAYLVAHGMAESYAQSPDADPAVVLQLARLDITAATAVRTQDDGATAKAVAALTAYAARQAGADPAIAHTP